MPRPSSAASIASHTRMTSGANVYAHTSAPTDEQARSEGGMEIRNVRVVLRVRPAGSTESSPPRHRNVLVHPISPTDVRIDVDPAALIGQSAPSNAAKRHPTFTFDQVLDQQAGQEELYNATAKDVVEEYMKGHNVTFLAYGQTSSGKSYSMGTTGDDVDYHGANFTPRTGLIPRTVKAIFDQAEALRIASGPGATWECRLSFLELYNEEIIDLLSGSGVQIAIREERDGRIIWSGVKEVPVRSLSEVMMYLQDGSTKRKTGETGMNATSSRSHAIFSLTVTQKRRSSVSTSPTTPTMKRPVSYANLPPRAGTPTKGAAPPVSLSTRNSGIPTIASGIPRSSSVMSMRGEEEMVVVTSKFNMVDLAGSERLKRTAAQGERMREGISINSGLSALGNVISALSDPVKAKGHIPYRDSKLTRMLQDSIGGNALTTMIACVSPVEYNIAETLNTIKYASRARNIKNSAKINAVEAGWDDVEHLQNTVLKLRKQLAQIEADGGSLVRSTEAINKGMGVSQEAQRQSEKLIQRLAELQKEHTDLYDKYLAKCNDNMRLTSELRATVPGDADALAKFNETVEPVILEYEKVVNALNVQLEDLRAQLSLMDTLYEEQGSALGEAQQAQTQAESYVEELRARIEKLNERNTSSEAYINDLEAKLKGYSDIEQSTSDSTAELRNQITKLREANKSLSQHATEIEARSSQADAQSSKLARQVEDLEKDLQRRDASYKELEERIVLLDTSNDNKALLAELEAKNIIIAELERKVDDAARDKVDKEKLETELESERALLADLQGQLADIGKRTPSSKGSLSIGGSSVEIKTEHPSPAEPGEQIAGGDSLQAALEAMKARVEAAENRYTKAEERIADLSAQLAEAHDEMSDTLATSPALSSGAEDDLDDPDLLSAKSTTPTPSTSRRGSLPILSTTGFGRGGSGSGSGFRGGRGGYGEMRMHQQHQITSSASMGHLGQRPLSLAAMATGSGSHKSLAALSKQRTRPQSLSQELSSAQRSATSTRASWSSNSLLFGQGPHTAPAPGSKTASTVLRTQQSIEAELKFVHQIIEERDTELRHKDKYIRSLENALSLSPIPKMMADVRDSAQTSNDSSHNLLSRSNSATHLRNTASVPIPAYIPLPSSPTLSPANPNTSLPHSESVDSLSALDTPATPATAMLPPVVAVITPSNEIVDPLNGDAPIHQLIHDARDKESSQRHIIEQQFVQIADLQKANHVLRGQLAGGYPEVYRSLVKVQAERDALLEQDRRPTRSAPSSPPASAQSLNAIREEHASEIQALIHGHVQAIQELEAEHETALATARSAVSQTSDMASKEQQAILDRIAAEHTSLVLELKTAHAKALTEIHAEAEGVQNEINTALLDSEEKRRQLKLKVDQAVFELSRVKDERSIAFAKSQQQVADLERTKGDLETAISSLQDAKADVDARVAELQKDKDEWLNHLVELQNTISDLTRRNSELEASNKAAQRKTVQHPPQGPPPNMPLPPTPMAAPGTPLSPTFRTSTPLAVNRSGSAGSHASLRGLGIAMPADAPGISQVSVTDADVDAAVNLLPPHLGQIVKSLQRSREDAIRDGERMRKVSESGRISMSEAESSLAEQMEKAAQLQRDLADARKTNSKLRAHLEDARQDNRRISDENRDFLSELNERRSQLSKIDEVKRAERESLLAANQQVAKLKAQLQQASDGKVNKKTGGLKCF